MGDVYPSPEMLPGPLLLRPFHLLSYYCISICSLCFERKVGAGQGSQTALNPRVFFVLSNWYSLQIFIQHPITNTNVIKLC